MMLVMVQIKSRSELAGKIEEKRRSLGLSQEAFAKECGVTRATVIEWEAGRAAVSPGIVRCLNLLSLDSYGKWTAMNVLAETK